MLRPGTILPGPQTVSHDIKSIYAEMSKNVGNYFMVTYILFRRNCYYINKYMTRLLTPPFIWSWMGGQHPLLHLFWEFLLCGFQMVHRTILEFIWLVSLVAQNVFCLTNFRLTQKHDGVYLATVVANCLKWFGLEKLVCFFFSFLY